MPLTYQPFAETPAVDRLRSDLQMNVGNSERFLSALAGATLVGLAFERGGWLKWVAGLGGLALIRRAVTGHCEVYDRLHIDHRHGVRGVPGNRGTRVEDSIDINCSAEVLYDFWRDLEKLPRVMRNVESVKVRRNKRSHWRVRGPGGRILEWDAEIINDHQGRLIAWESLPGSTVRNAGSVRFEPIAAHRTRVKVAFEFDPPAGSLGVVIADLLGSSPQADLTEDLHDFKEFAETELARAAVAAFGRRR